MYRTVRIKADLTLCCMLIMFLVPFLVVVYVSISNIPDDNNDTSFGKVIEESKFGVKFRVRRPSVDKRNIFFIESSCMKGQERNLTRGIQLNARQACAVESTVRANPQALVYLLHTCPLDEQHLVASEEFVKELFSHPNVFGFHVDVARFLEGTPLHGWYPSPAYDSSEYPVQQGADILSLVTLWKFGGIYLDLDIFVFKSLTDLGSNFAGSFLEFSVSTSVLALDPRHPLAEECLNEVKTNFDPRFVSSGPLRMTRALLKYCHVQTWSEITPENCQGFKVYPRHYFYPIAPNDVSKFFVKRSEFAMDMLKLGALCYVAKTWSLLSDTMRVYRHRLQGYTLLAEQYCPLCYRHSVSYM